MTNNIIEYTWEQLDEDVNKFYTWATNINYKPDLIGGVTRGGAIPAIMLSHKFNVPCKLIEWSTRDFEKRDTTTVDFLADQAKYGRKVLIFDDIVDSGKTISELKERMCVHKYYSTWATLWYNPSQPCPIHWWARLIDRKLDLSWIRFCWEV